MLDYIRLVVGDRDELLHETENRAVARADGFVGIAAPRRSVRPRPQAHGTIDESRWLDERTYTVEGECWGANPGAAETDYAELTAAMFDTLDPELTGTLKWQLAGGGLELQADVKLAAGSFPPLAGAARFVQYQAQLVASDPRAYAQALTTVSGATLSAVGGGKVYPYTYPRTFEPVGGGTAELLVAGQVPTPPVLRIYGYCTSPQVRLTSTGETIALTGEVGAGSFVEVDVRARTVTLNGLTPALYLLDYEQTTWWELPTGPQTVELLSNNFDTEARVEVLYRAAYL